jgi:hypothetical protein
MLFGWVPLPAAMHAFAAVHDTPRSALEDAPLRLGVD